LKLLNSMRFIIFFCLLTNVIFSQNIQNQKALEYYNGGEYDKAIIIYEELIKKQISPSIFEPYFTSLLKLGLNKNAKYLSVKYNRKYPNYKQYELSVIIAKDKLGEIKSIDKTYRDFFYHLEGKRYNVINVANFLIRLNYYERALELYDISEEINHQNNFGLQKANIYSKIGKVEKMLNEYLDQLQSNPNLKSYVTNHLQRFLNNNGIKDERNFQLVKRLLLSKVRQEENRTDFSEMLIWLFVQNEKYDLALNQAIALDKRTNSCLEEVYNLANFFLDNEEYGLAVKAFDYILLNGEKSGFFIDSHINKLYALVKSSTKTDSEIENINLNYKKVISNLGLNTNTVILHSNYAHFLAFYKFDLDKAKQVLNKIILLPNIDLIDLAECKMEYADILVLNGEIWDALLYYSQVEKDFKENPIGHEAKFRKAKVYYYQGDFEWAQSQFEVLKASTSKLTANNAMSLSLLITDNYNLDTSNHAMKTFAKADLLIFQRKYDKAIVKLDSILNFFPGHSLTDEIYMKKAKIYFDLDSIELALENYKKIETDWKFDIQADDAIFNSAKIYEETLNDEIEAMNLYHKLITDFSSSIYAAEARFRFREIKNKQK
tara:strand:- start:3113 stop:4924 length:1812 start_codon:yes stop_codon:yes gene_type:complete